MVFPALASAGPALADEGFPTKPFSPAAGQRWIDKVSTPASAGLDKVATPASAGLDQLATLLLNVGAGLCAGWMQPFGDI